MALYHPRCIVQLVVPNVGSPEDRVNQESQSETTTLTCRCHHVRLDSNSHNEADECEVTLSYDDAGIDPRFLRSAEVYVFLGDGDALGNFTPNSGNLRFLGIATNVERALSESSGKDIKIRALDYTTLFIAAKPYPPSKVPSLSATLIEAWNLVCDNTGFFDPATKAVVSTVQRFKNRLTIVGLPDAAAGLTLGSAVSPRLAKLGTLQAHQGADAWAVWQTAVGSLGLITFIRGDQCIVTTATDYYTADDPPLFAWGKNIVEMRETRDVHALSSKNVGVESFNPLTGQTLEAFYPPLSAAVSGRGKKKKLGASALGPGVSVKAGDYEIFDCPMPITDQDVLDRFAERIWQERARQELTGEFKTMEMSVDSLEGKDFDLLTLQSGDRVIVQVDRDALTFIQQLQSPIARTSELRRLGYSAEMANYIVTNLDAITKLPPEFQVQSVSTTLDTGSPPGSYEMTVKYLNRIDTSGASQVSDATSPGAPPVSGQKTTKNK